ncbi:MAG: cell division protein FtsK [Ramlibacter sp.]|nr:cell division protein FtsK [Ramlibacter sp.]
MAQPLQEGAGQPEAHGAGLPDTGLSTPGASAPQAEVVDISAAKKRKRVAADQGTTPPPPPHPPKSANAQSGGQGDEPPRKTTKTVDWTKFNYLLAQFALIYGTDTVWDGANRLIMKIANMAHAHGSDVVKLWKASEQRRTIMPSDVVFDPTEQCDPERCVNLFGGILLEPKEGDVKPVLELIRFLTSRASTDADECDNIMHWLLCWLAYPLQHPGTKLRTAVIMHGDEGAGKNFLFDLWVEIYGKYGALVGQDELEDKFNDWRSAKLAVVGDEVSSRAELVHNKNRLKALITSPSVQINPKNLPRREERNHINIVFLSNELQPLALDNSDRRYLVIYTPRAREFEFYRQLKEWKEGGGLAAFYAYLLEYPLDDFDPFAPAPLTQAKLDLIDMNRKSPERFWLEWANGELDLPYRTCSMAQAYRAYLKYAQRTGDRFPMQRPVFTRMVLRISEAMAPVLDPPKQPAREWIAAVTEDMAIGRKTTRMLLVTDRPEHINLGEWATECVKNFEQYLSDYLGYEPRSPDGKQQGSKGGDE